MVSLLIHPELIEGLAGTAIAVNFFLFSESQYHQ
jgi:hypothetical protein